MTTRLVAIIFCGVLASSRGFLRIVNRSVLSGVRYVSFAQQKTAAWLRRFFALRHNFFQVF
jgi:hypothetical protein